MSQTKFLSGRSVLELWAVVCLCVSLSLLWSGFTLQSVKLTLAPVPNLITGFFAHLLRCVIPPERLHLWFPGFLGAGRMVWLVLQSWHGG